MDNPRSTGSRSGDEMLRQFITSVEGWVEALDVVGLSDAEVDRVLRRCQHLCRVVAVARLQVSGDGAFSLAPSVFAQAVV